MTSVKAQELSYDEWNELLRPFGWAEITVRSPAVRFRVPPSLLEYEIRVMLQPGSGDSDDTGEWSRRSGLLEQARKAVEAVQARGYRLHEPPRVEFGGRYVNRLGVNPVWVAEASLYFTCELH
jgi:hypothetical protein